MNEASNAQQPSRSWCVPHLPNMWSERNSQMNSNVGINGSNGTTNRLVRFSQPGDDVLTTRVVDSLRVPVQQDARKRSREHEEIVESSRGKRPRTTPLFSPQPGRARPLSLLDKRGRLPVEGSRHACSLANSPLLPTFRALEPIGTNGLLGTLERRELEPKHLGVVTKWELELRGYKHGRPKPGTNTIKYRFFKILVAVEPALVRQILQKSGNFASYAAYSNHVELRNIARSTFQMFPLNITDVRSPQFSYLLWSPFREVNEIVLDRVNCETAISVVKIFGTCLQHLRISRGTSLPLSPNYQRFTTLPVSGGLKFSQERNHFNVIYDEARKILLFEQNYEVRRPRQHALLPPCSNRKFTLVLDMDETLIHACTTRPDLFHFTFVYENKRFYVAKRPYVGIFLEEMAKYAELIVFTAGVKTYADPILDFLDPKRLISHRLYRDSTSMIHRVLKKTEVANTLEGAFFVKDLSVLGRPLERVALLDNSPKSFLFQPENGLLSKTWTKDFKDQELYQLKSKLVELSLNKTTIDRIEQNQQARNEASRLVASFPFLSRCNLK